MINEGRVSGDDIKGLSTECPTDQADMPLGAGRLNARAAIAERIHRLRHEARQLEELLDALPAKMPPAADAALWQLVISASRSC